MLLTLYKTLILPITDFADIIYHKKTLADADLLRLQNVACHAVLKVDIYAHIVDMHESLNLVILNQGDANISAT